MIKQNLYSILVVILSFIFLILISMLYINGNFMIEDIGAYEIHFYLTIVITLFALLVGLFIKNKSESLIIGIGHYNSFIFISTIVSIVCYVALIILYRFDMNSYVNINIYSFIEITLKTLFFGTIALAFYYTDLKKHLKKFIKKFPTYLIILLFSYFGIIILNNFFLSISDLIPQESNVAANQEIINSMFELEGSKIFLILSIVVVGPFVEELIYRYILIDKVLLKIFKVEYFNINNKKEFEHYSKTKKIKSIFWLVFISTIAGVLFASAHAMQAITLTGYIRDIFIYFGFAFGISLTYMFTRNIFVTYSLHLINNLLSVIAIMYYLSK